MNEKTITVDIDKYTKLVTCGVICNLLVGLIEAEKADYVIGDYAKNLLDANGFLKKCSETHVDAK